MTRPPPGAAITVRFEYTRCNKGRCQQCPHGPYVYHYWHEGKRLRKMYVGRLVEGSAAGKERGIPDNVSSVTRMAHMRKPGKSRKGERARMSGVVDLQKTKSQLEALAKGAESWDQKRPSRS